MPKVPKVKHKITSCGLEYTLVPEDDPGTCCLRCVFASWRCAESQHNEICKLGDLELNGCEASEQTPQCRAIHRRDNQNYYFTNVRNVTPEIPIIVSLDEGSVCVGIPDDLHEHVSVKVINWDIDEDQEDDGIVGLIHVQLPGAYADQVYNCRAAVYDGEYVIVPRDRSEETNNALEKAMAVYDRTHGGDNECEPT